MLISKAALGPAKSKCNILGATFLALSALCRALTPDFDPTIVNWNHPDVEYLMKHFKMAMASHDDEIAALRKSNEDLRRAYGEPEAKCKALLEMYNRLAGKGAVAASGAGCSDAAAAPLPCGSVPALKLRHCHTTTLPRGTSAPATRRQPDSSAVQSGGAHVLAALPVVAKMCKVRRSCQVCHWGRPPHAVRRPPNTGLPLSTKFMKTKSAGHTPLFHSWFSCDFRSPYSRAVSHTLALFPMPVEFPHTFSRLPMRFRGLPYTGRLPIWYRGFPIRSHA